MTDMIQAYMMGREGTLPVLAANDAAAGSDTLTARALGVSDWGVDTSQKLNAEQYQFIASRGAKFVVRYLPHAGQAPGIGVDANEVLACVSAGLGIMLVQFARTSSLTPQ